jgi:glyoxylase-like metal-dependent hydrolase (beta-lactamase superfamily II)
MRLIFEQIRVGGDRNFGYLLADREARRGVLIDPSYSPEAMVDRAREQGLVITHVVNTHGHPDHTNGNERAQELTGAPLAAHAAAASCPTVALDDADTLAVGSLQLSCIHTPGHCDDHVVLYETTHRLLITGDLLFVGKVGGTRTEDDARVEWNSLQRVLERAAPDATVWPGHDYGARPSSTIFLERQTNPFLLCRDVEAFLRLKQDWAAFKKTHGLR